MGEKGNLVPSDIPDSEATPMEQRTQGQPFVPVGGAPGTLARPLEQGSGRDAALDPRRGAPGEPGIFDRWGNLRGEGAPNPEDPAGIGIGNYAIDESRKGAGAPNPEDPTVSVRESPSRQSMGGQQARDRAETSTGDATPQETRTGSFFDVFTEKTAQPAGLQGGAEPTPTGDPTQGRGISDLAVCSHCGNPAGLGNRFCPTCGQPLS